MRVSLSYTSKDSGVHFIKENPPKTYFLYNFKRLTSEEGKLSAPVFFCSSANTFGWVKDMTRWCHCPLVSAGKLIIRCFSTFREPLLLLGFLVHLHCHHPKTKTKSNRHTHTQKKKEQCKSNYTVCTRTRESSPPFTAVQTHNLPCSSRLCSRFFAAKSYCGSCVVD